MSGTTKNIHSLILSLCRYYVIYLIIFFHLLRSIESSLFSCYDSNNNNNNNNNYDTTATDCFLFKWSSVGFTYSKHLASKTSEGC